MIKMDEQKTDDVTINPAASSKAVHGMPKSDERRDMSKRQRKEQRPSGDLENAAYDSGGTLLRFKFKDVSGVNDGCGAPVRVVGTNGDPCHVGRF